MCFATLVVSINCSINRRWAEQVRCFPSKDQVNMALKTLTFLYIGGASSTAQLFSCQSEDGGAGRNRNRIVDLQDDCIAEGRTGRTLLLIFFFPLAVFFGTSTRQVAQCFWQLISRFEWLDAAFLMWPQMAQASEHLLFAKLFGTWAAFREMAWLSGLTWLPTALLWHMLLWFRSSSSLGCSLMQLSLLSVSSSFSLVHHVFQVRHDCKISQDWRASRLLI